MLSLNLNGIQDQDIRENFKDIQDAFNALPVSSNFQAIELYVTANVTGLKIGHKLGGVPLDVIITRLIAPSATRLTAKYSEFTKDEVVFDISGLGSNEVLSARLCVGSFSDVVGVGTVKRGDAETQQNRSKF